MSNHLQWMIVRNCSSFVVKKRNIKKHFSTDPLNMKKIHSPRYCGTIQKNAIMIEPHSNKKGVNLVYKKKRCHRKPAKSLERVPLTKNARRTMTVIKKFVKRNQYRKDLKMLALRRASAILKSQRPVVLKKKTFKKKPE
ncbi:60S ribosomal protein L28-like [Argiope bruennichi]|uniref:60S ribosomal protein L28-like n=1 Tax=Argiope bruennichi TaxID=94029 RepID=UPI0024955535|nr:60S ribosomal protein L28-like [Argiope bruennichi]XP_055932135.1 60S ribosomal protein L28-like [Argiope bruennichi]